MTGTSFLPVLIVIIVVTRIRRIVNRFLETGTTSPKAARSLPELNMRHSLLFSRLVRRNVIIEVAPGRYYLDESNYADYRQRRRSIALIILAVCIFLIALDVIFFNF
jgi:hypothetical protein